MPEYCEVHWDCGGGTNTCVESELTVDGEKTTARACLNLERFCGLEEAMTEGVTLKYTCDDDYDFSKGGSALKGIKSDPRLLFGAVLVTYIVGLN